MAGRSIHGGTEMGLITIMYSAKRVYRGFAAFHIALVAGIVTFFIGLTGFIVVPLRKLNILTIPEFYEKRFGKDVRVLGGIMLAIGGILNMGLFLKVGAMFIVGVSGLSATILPWVMTILLIIILIYTCFGGMWSVIITDFTQFTILSLGLLTVVGLSITTIGWDTIFDTILTIKALPALTIISRRRIWRKLHSLDDFYSRIGQLRDLANRRGRALAMKSEKLVKQQYMITSVTFMIRFLIPYFLGICAFVYFSIQQPTLFAEFSTSSTNTLYALPYYFKSILPIGILGLLIAAMIAAFMSTHDGYLLCWSSVITQDIIAPLTKKTLTQPQRLRITRICIVLIGIYIWYWGLFYNGPDDIWDYMAITGAIYFTGAFALLVTGLYWKKASRIGALSALLCGFTAILGLGPIREWLNLSFLTGAQIGLFTIALTLSVMVIGSLLYPDSQQKVATP